MLILRNLGLSISPDTSVYQSVMNAWRASLTFMENLISGMPQAVESPAVLLAMSAWHLYPDMAVLQGRTRNIKQNDPLITPGGIVTIGLQNANLGTDFDISWSLPLSHLRYYGKPVDSTGSIGTRSSRISMEKLLLVCFGSVTTGWVRQTEDNSLCARYFILLRKAVEKGNKIPEWLDLLSDTASGYLSYTREARAEADVLIGFGRRRCQSFLSSQKSLPTAFNIVRPDVFARLIDGNEAKIRWLRQRFGKFRPCDQTENEALTDAIILYRPVASDCQSILPMTFFNPDSQSESPRLESCDDLDSQSESTRLESCDDLDSLSDSTRLESCDDLDSLSDSTRLESYGELFPTETWMEFASLFPVFLNESEVLSHRRWLPVLPTSSMCRLDAKGFLHRYPNYARIPIWSAERSFNIESMTGEPCTISVHGPLRGNDKRLIGNLLSPVDREHTITWNEPPHRERSARIGRPIQGYFLRQIRLDEPESPEMAASHALVAASTSAPTPRWPPPRGFGRPIHPRSFSFLSETGAAYYAPSIADCDNKGSLLQRGLQWTMPFLSPRKPDPNIALTEEVMRISNICQDKFDVIFRQNQEAREATLSERTSSKDDEVFAQRLDDDSHSSTQCACLYEWYMQDHSSETKGVFKRIFGNMDSVAIFIPTQSQDLQPDADVNATPSQALASMTGNSAILPELGLNEVVDALDSNLIDTSALRTYLLGSDAEFWATEYRTHLASLNALHFADVVYSNLAGALVDLSATARPVHEYHWSAPCSDILAHARSFSCIATLESGHLNISPTNLVDVMGMSTGNSLYIAEFLWSDPHSPPPSSIIRRSIGNVGKPGMAFLISPVSPKMKEPDFTSWKSVQHVDFDGKLEASFEGTSVHLSFTGYEQALDTGEHGLVDKEVYLLEAVVQAYDRGSWFSDLDVLAAINSQVGRHSIKRLPAWGSCSHEESLVKDSSQIGQITSIDDWIELLDQPNNACIVRTGGNWLARLTATVIAIQKCRPVIVTPERICWACVSDTHSNFAMTIIVA